MLKRSEQCLPQAGVAAVERPVAARINRTATSVSALAARMRRDEGGNVTIVFGFMIIPCIMLVGMAVDWGRIIAARQQTQVALDNAALAAARAAQNASTTDILTKCSLVETVIDPSTLASTPDSKKCPTDVAAEYFFAAGSQKLAHVIKSATTLTTNLSVAGEVKLTAMQWLTTPFMSATQGLGGAQPAYDVPQGTTVPSQCGTVAWNCQPLTVSSTAIYRQGGQNDGYNMETSLMLDITGSMSGTPLTDMKAAAKDLIDIVIWADQSKNTSKVAIAPFSARVNVGTYAAAVTGLVASKTVSGSIVKLRPCVSERIGTNAFTDAAPGLLDYVAPYAASSSGLNITSSSNWNSSGTCGSSDPAHPIQPLTTDKTVLKNLVDSLAAGGATAGHLGTAWAWYMLSPNWSSIWPTSSDPKLSSTPEAYSLIADKKLKKIAVLMTDGDYNTDYAGTDNSETQAGKLCTGMKNKSIEVFTVGFGTGMSGSAKDFLKSCATDASHYYEATSGDALKAAFRDIALKIVTVRITM